ncbi:hypothetical protein LCGC14_0194780 [marine sediment metagenome]|uniref:Uncharacterized protein n=1 Tax=marine sediment metagenome TaxID=412755 RepID=A0A0F9X475_9ZZZZ
MTSGKSRDHRRKKGTKTVDVSHEERTFRKLSKKKTAVASRIKDPDVRRSRQEKKGIYLGEYRRAIVIKKQKFDAAKRSQQAKLKRGDDDGREIKRMQELQDDVSTLRSEMDAELSDHPLFAIQLNDDLDADEQLREFMKQKEEDFKKETAETEKDRKKRLSKDKKGIAHEKAKSNTKFTVKRNPRFYKKGSSKVNSLSKLQDLAGQQTDRSPDAKSKYTRYYTEEGTNDLVFQTIIGSQTSSQYLLDLTVTDIDDDRLNITLRASDSHSVKSAQKVEGTAPAALGTKPYEPTRQDRARIRQLIIDLVDDKFSLRPGWDSREDQIDIALDIILQQVGGTIGSSHFFEFTIGDGDLDVRVPGPDTHPIPVENVVR